MKPQLDSTPEEEEEVRLPIQDKAEEGKEGDEKGDQLGGEQAPMGRQGVKGIQRGGEQREPQLDSQSQRSHGKTVPPFSSHF